MHTASPSSRNAKAAPQKVTARFGKDIAAVNGSGSENMKDAQAYLASRHITQYRTAQIPQGKALR
jgi:hypothetical protein